MGDLSSKEQEKIYNNPQNDTIEFELENNIKVNVRWTYFNKEIENKEEEKKEEKLDNEEEEEEERKKKVEEIVGLEFSTNYDKKLILHWGVFKGNNLTSWSHPPKESYPKNSIEFDKTHSFKLHSILHVHVIQ